MRTDMSPKNLSDNRLLLRVLIGLLLSLNVLNGLAPVLSGSSNVIARYLGAGIYFLLDPVCHQLPDRCIFIGRLPMALCVRCTFIYWGAFLGLLFLYRQKRIRLSRFLAYGALTFIAIEIVTEKIGLYANWPVLRGFSGFLLGLFVVLYFAQFRLPGKKEIATKSTSESEPNR